MIVMSLCDVCKKVEGKITISGEGERHTYCFDCHNEQMADELGVSLETQPKALSVTDFQGVRRDFAIIQHLDPIGISMEAEEHIEFGYQFAVHGELDCNQNELFQQLVDKVKHGVRKAYLKKGVFPNGQPMEYIKGDEVVGRIDYDEAGYATPMVVIDGKPYTWEQFGRLVSSYEGFQFKLKMYDSTDEVE
ncbi:MAG: hypothetical protein LRY73_11470 [Bacillus sp. (in: Bacteria)]|nr:hypothetical protein [Bacillus sp. (in: firmicutes)]